MRILVTGGAGFIGANLVQELLSNEKITHVKVLDNLATGSADNIRNLWVNAKFEFTEGDIRNYDTCLNCCEGINIISHQAALGSVPRSINDPLTTNEVEDHRHTEYFLTVSKRIKKYKTGRVMLPVPLPMAIIPGLPKVADKTGLLYRHMQSPNT
jgi:UDP-N-acetylglucosamine 4-epimerase